MFNPQCDKKKAHVKKKLFDLFCCIFIMDSF